MRASPSPNRLKKSWQSRVSFSSSKNRRTQSEDRVNRENTHPSTRSISSKNGKWWKTRLFHGMINDIRRRAPFYWSDWKDAWDYRVVPATVYMYFAKYVQCRQYQHHNTSKTAKVDHSLFLFRSPQRMSIWRARTAGLIGPAAFYQPSLSRSICLPRPIRVSASTRCFWLQFSLLLCFQLLLPSLWSSSELQVG